MLLPSLPHNGLRVSHVYRTYFPDPPGGLQEAIRQICLSTSGFGLTNRVFTLSPSPRPKVLQRPEALVVRSRSWAAPASCDLGGPESLRHFRELLGQTDVLHYLFPWPFGDVLHALSRPKQPAVLTYVSDVVRQQLLGKLYRPLMWKTLRDMKFIVANCPAYLEASPVLCHPEIRPKVRVIPLGIEESSYPAEGDEGIFSRLNLDIREPYFLFLGVLRYYKGLKFLLEAAREVRSRIVIAGSGPEEACLRASADELGLRHVIFAGQVTESEKVALLKRCRALVLPSHLRSEAFGMVLVEAAMFGRPLISCEIGTGTSYINRHEETGLVLPPGSPGSLAEAMNLLAGDELLSKQMGRAARARYETHFSGPALGRAYAGLFREALE